jgi:hypothetical protein
VVEEGLGSVPSRSMDPGPERTRGTAERGGDMIRGRGRVGWVGTDACLSLPHNALCHCASTASAVSAAIVNLAATAGH